MGLVGCRVTLETKFKLYSFYDWIKVNIKINSLELLRYDLYTFIVLPTFTALQTILVYRELHLLFLISLYTDRGYNFCNSPGMTQ